MECARRKPLTEADRLRKLGEREDRAHRRRIAARGYATVIQMQARAPTIGLLGRMYTLGRALFRTAKATLFDSLASPSAATERPRRDPIAPLTRFLRALTRITFLSERLQDPIPLPEPAPPKPRPARDPDLPPADPRPRPPSTLSRDARARADIQRLLKRYPLPEIIAMLCRDLGLPADPAEWNDAAILAVPDPGPPPFPTQPGASHQTAPPQIRPDPATDPPR